jgi:hypothetical protein
LETTGLENPFLSRIFVEPVCPALAGVICQQRGPRGVLVGSK